MKRPKSVPVPDEKVNYEMGGYFQLFKYSTFGEKTLLWFGLIGSCLSGFFTPFFGYVMGKIVLMFSPLLTVEESRETMIESAPYVFLIAFL